MARRGPFRGSVTTTVALQVPSACSAACLTTRSSPSTRSPTVESAKVGSVHGLTIYRFRWSRERCETGVWRPLRSEVLEVLDLWRVAPKPGATTKVKTNKTQEIFVIARVDIRSYG